MAAEVTIRITSAEALWIMRMLEDQARTMISNDPLKAEVERLTAKIRASGSQLTEDDVKKAAMQP